MQWQGFPTGSVVKSLPATQKTQEARVCPWCHGWQPTPVFLPGESHGERSLAGYSPWGRTELDATEAAEHAHTSAMAGLLPREERLRDRDTQTPCTVAGRLTRDAESGGECLQV